jgi:hypothetical protein
VDHYTETLERAKKQMVEDVLAGHLPYDVPDFATCHDHVDANCYGERTSGQCDHDFGAPAWTEDGETMNEAHLVFMNRLQEELDNWVKAGGLTEAARLAEPD